jgi:hypothetical protein
MALYTIEGSLIPMGYEQITGLSAVKALTIPAEAEIAVIAAETQNVRWRDDGSAPTDAVGMPLAAGRDMLFTSKLSAVRFIEETASAKLNVSYYKRG